jgi:hypothetical protein
MAFILRLRTSDTFSILLMPRLWASRAYSVELCSSKRAAHAEASRASNRFLGCDAGGIIMLQVRQASSSRRPSKEVSLKTQTCKKRDLKKAVQLQLSWGRANAWARQALA